MDKEWDYYEKVMKKVEQQENMTVYDAIKKINSSKITNKYFMYHAANDVEF